jgi:hypothetical protein
MMKGVNSIMKKVLIIVLIVVLFFPIILWIASIIKCETLTYRYWREFEGLEQSTNMLNKSETIKVLDYSNVSARIYYKDREGGDILRFIKQDGKWVLDKWEKTVWSRTGSADGFMWPYVR